MARPPRERCEGDVYHVVSRGVGRQRIFEDDEDRREFMERLRSACEAHGVQVLAWTLMENHFHLLLHAGLDEISGTMRRLQTGYAMYFNARHGHVGHLFQGRFKSVAVTSDAQLMSVVRYIHRNPVAAGQEGSCASCRWTSYRSYVGDAASEPEEGMAAILEMFGSPEEFERFHALDEDDSLRDYPAPRRRVGDAEADEIIRRECGGGEALAAMGKPGRDEAIRRLKSLGLSVRQIERLSGIGRSIIQRA